jgi:aspartyl-tRNA(Asn)/glutamyl-tRNA(Gln) amidotransferase subunit C
MEVNDVLVEKLAHLSRLEFDAKEKEEIKTDLQRMISFVDKLNELDLADTEPLLHMSDNINVLRDDKVKGSITRDEGLKNTPSHDDRFFKVPKVIKNPSQP